GRSFGDRPPHRSVRARRRIRLPPRMSGEKAYDRVGMQNAWCWDPASGNAGDPIPLHRLLAATTQGKPPQASQPLPEDTQPIDVSRDRMVLVIASHDLS